MGAIKHLDPTMEEVNSTWCDNINTIFIFFDVIMKHHNKITIIASINYQGSVIASTQFNTMRISFSNLVTCYSEKLPRKHDGLKYKSAVIAQ